jgi:glutathione S-transferase
MKPALYYAPNTCALAPYITLTEAGVEFNVHPINFRKQQNKSEEYMKLNPKHKVPLLIVDGETLTESPAIQIWIARNFPEANLLPADSWQELQAISLLSWCSSGIHPYISRLNSTPKVCDMPDAEESVRRLAHGYLTDVFGQADTLLENREFFFDHFTAPDAHFFWCCRRAQQLGHDLSDYTNCLSHFERMNGRASTQKLLAYEKEIQETFTKAA